MTDQSASPTSNVAEYSVSEISSAVKRSIEDTFGYVRVRAELGRVSRPASGHLYLDLKDDRAVLAGVIWKGAASKLTIKPEQGLEVICTGRLTTFPGQSKYQMVIDHMEHAGTGALMALLEERRKKFAAEGLFDSERKKPLPYLPKTVGVVTSPSGAVIRDILHRLSERFPVDVLVWPVRVQGEGCAEEVTKAIEGFNDMADERPDLIIVARGGGSIEDLWGFNEENVVRAAANSQIPLISAIGHETDWSLLDHVADLRAPTPTGAAEIAVPVRAELQNQVDDLSRRHKLAIARGLQNRRTALNSAARALPKPADFLASQMQRLDFIASRLAGALRTQVLKKSSRIETASAGLKPSILKRTIRIKGEALKQAQRRGVNALVSQTAMKNARAASLADRISSKSIEKQRLRCAETLARLAHSLDQALARRVFDANRKLQEVERLISAVSYKSVLERGFVLARRDDGAPVRSAAALAAGDLVTLEWYDGARQAQVADGALEPVKPAPGGEKTKRDGPKRARKSEKQSNTDQGTLF